jgi:hypothetical protein
MCVTVRETLRNELSPHGQQRSGACSIQHILYTTHVNLLCHDPIARKEKYEGRKTKEEKKRDQP